MSMTPDRFTFALALRICELSFVLCCLGLSACGDDGAGAEAAMSDGGTGGTGGTAGSEVGFAEFLAGGCFFASDCDGVAAYAACVQQECDAVFRQCLGQGYRTQDFSGSPCASHYECVIASGNLCANECVADDACASCASEEIGPCVTSSACTRPVCMR